MVVFSTIFMDTAPLYLDWFVSNEKYTVILCLSVQRDSSDIDSRLPEFVSQLTDALSLFFLYSLFVFPFLFVFHSSAFSLCVALSFLVLGSSKAPYPLWAPSSVPSIRWHSQALPGLPPGAAIWKLFQDSKSGQLQGLPHLFPSLRNYSSTLPDASV